MKPRQSMERSSRGVCRRPDKWMQELCALHCIDVMIGLDSMDTWRQKSPVLSDEELEDLCGSLLHEVGGQHGEQALNGLPDGLVGCPGLLVCIQAEPVLSKEGICKGPESLIDLAKFS